MKQTIILFQLICLVGAIVSEGILFFQAKSNDQIIVSITLLLIFGAVGTGLLILAEKIFKKPTNW